MSGRKRRGGKSGKGKVTPDDPDYLAKRLRNNEAVHRSREKTRQLEAETAEKVDKLKTENAELERRVQVLNKELGFLKEMFVAYASGKGKEVGEKSGASETSNASGEAAYAALCADQTGPSSNTRHSSRQNSTTQNLNTSASASRLPNLNASTMQHNPHSDSQLVSSTEFEDFLEEFR